MQQPEDTETGFSSFLVNEGNSSAFDACQEIADLDNLDARLLLIVAESGSGKTHLLTAIVEQIRASSNRAGIAYIADGIIPAEVESLLENPSRVENAEHAILLIDDLEQFAPDIETIEALLTLFFENRHAVIFASNTHPSRLEGLPKNLTEALEQGEIIEMSPVDSECLTQALSGKARREMEEVIEEKGREIIELSTRLESAEALISSDVGDGPEALLRQAVEDLTQELTNARIGQSQHIEEIEELKASNALLSVAGKEVGPLRERIKRLEDAGADENPVESDQSLAIRHQLEEARADARKARSEAQGMLQRAEKLIRQMNENRVEFEDAQSEQKQHWDEIQKLEDVFTLRAGGDHEEVPAQASELEASATADLDHAKEIEELQLQRERVQESLVRAHSERDTAKALLERTRGELDETRRDLDKVRGAASDQVDDERAKVAPLEHALIEANAEIAELREAQRVVTDELFSLQSQLSEGTGVLERLMHIFGVPDEPEANESGEETIAVDEVDAEATTAEVDTKAPDESVFRADFGEGLNKDTNAPSSLHHVEELDSNWSNPPKVDDSRDDIDPSQSHTKSA